MKVTDKKIMDKQAFFTVEIEPAEMDKSMEESYNRLVKKAKIPGFRQGKAPRPVLERQLGKSSLLEDTLNHLVPKAYTEAVKEQAIEAFAQPQIEVTKTDPLIFKAIVPLMPDVKLGDYTQIRLKPEKTERVTKKDVDASLKMLQHQHASWEPVEREVQLNDLVTMDIESIVDEQPFINQKGIQYQVSTNSSYPLPGFRERLIGMKKMAETEIKLIVPSDYTKAELAGKDAWFKVKIIEIKQERLPSLNNEFAREINPDYTTLDSLKEAIHDTLQQEAEKKAKRDYEERAMDVVVEKAQIEYPAVLVEAEIDRLINQQLSRWQMNLEDYLKKSNKTGEELKKELNPAATKRVARSLVLGKIAEGEKIEVDDADIDAQIVDIKKNASGDATELEKFLSTQQARRSVEQTLLAEKTVQKLVEIAQGSTGKGKVKKVKTEEGKDG